MRIAVLLLLLLVGADPVGAYQGAKETSIEDWQFMVRPEVCSDTSGTCGACYASTTATPCGGSHIGDGWVLTAEHCLDHYLGSRPLCDARAPHVCLGGARSKIESYCAHPWTDLALLRLELALPFAPSATPPPKIELSTEPTLRGEDLVGLGWGEWTTGTASSVLGLVDDLIYLESASCRRLIESAAVTTAWGVPPGSLCTIGRSGTGPCRGDSGGPLLAPVGQGHRQVGVTSEGWACSGVPLGTFVDVGFFRDWIERVRIAADLSADHEPPLCRKPRPCEPAPAGAQSGGGG